MKYRAEIDGLRALAVLPVILFHAGFDWFSGGFVGVDIFFVISGFLITSQIIRDLEAGSFSIIDFYRRRARRILPALFVVMGACIPFAAILMTQSQLKDFYQSLIAVSFFVSNVLFWRESGYFEAVAEEKPLLHTWSLSVEEQYYLFVPLFLCFTWKFGRRRVWGGVATIAILSLLLGEWAWRNAPVANFYLLPTRIWELFVGALGAFLVRDKGHGQSDLLSILGLAAIVGAVFIYDEQTPFPSLAALLPTVGAILVILYADPRTLVGRCLSCRPMVWIGLISYSLYLWHQPIFAFTRLHYQPSEGLSLPRYQIVEDAHIVALILLSLCLAFLTWRFVEQPFRRRQGRGSSNVPHASWIVPSLVGLLAFSMVGMFGLTQGRPQEISNSLVVSDTWAQDVRQHSCLLQELHETSHEDQCFAESKTVLLWGDSHAASLSIGLRRIAAEQGFGLTQLTQSGCPPLLSLERLVFRKNCNEINDRILDTVADSQFDNIVLHGAWLHEHYPLAEPEVSQKLSLMLQRLTNISQRPRIVIVGAVPRWSGSPNHHLTTRTDGRFQYGRTAYVMDEVNEVLRAVAIEAGVIFVDPKTSLCPTFEQESECILAVQSVDDESWLAVTKDYGHLSRVGSRILADAVVRELQLEGQMDEAPAHL